MNNLDKITLRSKQYWFDDGLVELLVGGLFAILAGFFWWQMATNAGGLVMGIAMAIAMPLIILVGAFGMGWLLRTLKERLIYPRTGYVTYARPQKNQRRRSRLLGLFFGLFFATLITQFRLEAWLPVLMGSALGLYFFVLGYRMALLRFQLLAIWSIAAGVMLVYLETAALAASALILLLVAAALIFSGTVNLLRYLANTRPSSDQPAEVG